MSLQLYVYEKTLPYLYAADDHTFSLLLQVFTVTTSVDIETPSLPPEEGEEHEVEGRLEEGGGVLPSSPRSADGASMEPASAPEAVEHHRITSSVAAGPLTVVLPPEYQHQH